MTENKQLFINLISQIIAFAVNLSINFFVTPYIVEQLGSEAYGFIGLANNFVNYASIVTIALNSMLGRFVTINFHQGNIKKANMYYNSVLLANVILSVIMLIPSILCVIYIEKIINVPAYLLFDVKWTFAIVFANFLLSIIISVFGLGFFVKNKLYINSMVSIGSNIIKVLVIVGLFVIFKPNITFMVIGTLVASLFIAVSSLYYNKKLMPELKFDKRDVSKICIKELFASGIWNVITKLSQILTSGLDLLIANIFIDAMAMGVLSLSKTVSTVISSFISSLASVFSPNLTILYAKNNINEMVKDIKSAIKIIGVFIVIPNVILIVLGKDFFSLWLPNQNANLLQVLSVLAVINSCISGPIQPLYQVFTITNTVKVNSKILILNAFMTFIFTLIILNCSSLGVFAIAGVSTITAIIVALIFHIPFSAKVLGLKWNTFYSGVIKCIIALVIEIAVGWFIKSFFVISNWISWIGVAVIIGCVGLIISILVILNNIERKFLINKIRKMLRI